LLGFDGEGAMPPMLLGFTAMLVLEGVVYMESAVLLLYMLLPRKACAVDAYEP